LTYRGDIWRSAGGGGRVSEKQMLRYHFNSQLRKVWESHNVLREVPRGALQQPVVKGTDYDVPRPIPTTNPPLAGFLFRRQLRGLWFIPMITMPMEAHCHLTLKIGRPMKPRHVIFDGGDLDGRLKTLFDALAVPTDEAALPVGATGDEGEVLCLLADDSLITGLTIESYQLLGRAVTRTTWTLTST
jgi:hypothetical protein